MSDDPEKAVDAETWIASEKAKQAERKRLKEQYALADVEANTTILKYPIEVSTGVASFDVKSKPKKSKDVKEPLDEALVNEILGEQQSTGNGPNFTFKQAPKEEPKPEDVADEEAV